MASSPSAASSATTASPCSPPSPAPTSPPTTTARSSSCRRTSGRPGQGRPKPSRPAPRSPPAASRSSRFVRAPANQPQTPAWEGRLGKVLGEDGHLEHERAVLVLVLEHHADELLADIDLGGVLLL